MSLDYVRMAPMANAIRALAMDAVQKSGNGHPGMPMGMADVATVLYSKYLKFDPKEPQWPDRDRFVLSAGHGSMLLYALLYLSGYEQPTIIDIEHLRQLDSPCAGHPENYLIAGAEATTGPLGQGLAMAVGMAIAERHLNAEFGDALVDHKTWVVAGDGCLMEGINHEAIGLAGHLKLGRLNILYDDNRITIDGSTELSRNEDIPARYKAFGWHVEQCDGHDYADIDRALQSASIDPRPSLVVCRTIIGKGAPNKQGTHAVHGNALGADEVAAARINLGWTAPAFVIPDDILADWHSTGDKGAAAHAEWQARADQDPKSAVLVGRIMAELPPLDAAKAVFEGWLSGSQNVATRKASELVLEQLTAIVPGMIAGSADLTPSNNTMTKAVSGPPLDSTNYGGRYIHYGIREFGMAAAMNGMALHGGIVPYGGTFLVFSDYCRNAIRLAAIQRIGVVFVMTHDSIGVGEDGPTHQPIEHIMSLRMIPELNVMRPADVIETAECWMLALKHRDRPTVMVLSRQNLPQLRTTGGNLSSQGGYRLKAADAPRKLVIVATGSEVSLAVDVAKALEGEGIGTDVVSIPCTEIFDEQDKAYIADLLPADVLKVSIEAGVTLGWQKYVGDHSLTFGVNTFGASGKAEDLYKHFGLTVDAIVPQIREKLGQ
jgi:transketolase